MGRWTEPDGDDYRLPEGMKRVGYDSDRGRYYFRDRKGALYDGEQGSEFGEMTRVHPAPIAIPEEADDIKAAPPRADDYEALATEFDAIPQSRYASTSASEADHNKGRKNFDATEKARTNNPEQSQKSVEKRAAKFEAALKIAKEETDTAKQEADTAKKEADAARAGEATAKEEAEAQRKKTRLANQRIAELEAEMRQLRRARPENA